MLDFCAYYAISWSIEPWTPPSTWIPPSEKWRNFLCEFQEEKEGSYWKNVLCNMLQEEIEPWAAWAAPSPTWRILPRGLQEEEEEKHITCKQKTRFSKIMATCIQAHQDGYDYIWIDTCCINSGDHSQQSQDINSMFECYKNSGICYVYLYNHDDYDHDHNDDNDNGYSYIFSFLETSSWFS
ncbi:hypothetical protein D9758_015749 [Tetrapyrgos nigripes]|uniref:Heterokaryon incompatibility domain-containing protein n=1 Tax=Tetrapyrgos nigripes TaxID=182062 RepID=A0A8H5CAS6_9AGAR|nr:hypothetical protein D9758_015749 [Tetrapyrgos nigripes]